MYAYTYTDIFIYIYCSFIQVRKSSLDIQKPRDLMLTKGPRTQTRLYKVPKASMGTVLGALYLILGQLDPQEFHGCYVQEDFILQVLWILRVQQEFEIAIR